MGVKANGHNQEQQYLFGKVNGKKQLVFLKADGGFTDDVDKAQRYTAKDWMDHGRRDGYVKIALDA